MSSTLESEDLENVQLVRMEDVQPSRERPCESVIEEEEVETCVIDDLEYDNECVVDGNYEDSNIGSMVWIKSEEVADYDDGSGEIIVPEILAPKKSVEEVETNPEPNKIPTPESWPTLEILPGGVINHLEKCEEEDILTKSEDDTTENSGMYACAKCSQRFQFLFNLVKHVRWHELEKKRKMEPDLATLCAPVRVFKKNYVYLESSKINEVLWKTCKKPIKKVVKRKPKKSKS